MAGPKYTYEQIRHQAQENALAYLLAAVVFFKQQARSPQQFFAFVGKTLLPEWQHLKGHGPRVVIETLGLHIVSLGATLVAMEGDDELAYATFAHLPPSDRLKFLGLSRDEADAIWDIYAPIAASLNLTYTWSRQQDEVTFKLARAKLPRK
ncbi:MAG TPA: hypothetical protein VKV20_13635 [Ktedonobacteraceae bacterium]|nr:hypothetical protein [Ktedonobacteraceae bacterium]